MTVVEAAKQIDAHMSYSLESVEPIGSINVPIAMLVALRKALRQEGHRD